MCARRVAAARLAVLRGGISLFHVSACNPGAIGPGVGRLSHSPAASACQHCKSPWPTVHFAGGGRNFSSARDALHTRPWSRRRVDASLNVFERCILCFVNRAPRAHQKQTLSLRRGEKMRNFGSTQPRCVNFSERVNV